VTNAKSLLAVSIVKQLKTLQEQLQEYRARIEEAFAQHPDHDTFDSLPGAGPKLAPRLLAELGANRKLFPSAEDLQCYAGTAPVTIKSGKRRWAKFAPGLYKTLRCTVHLWSTKAGTSAPGPRPITRRSARKATLMARPCAAWDNAG